MADQSQDILAGWEFNPARYAGHTPGPWRHNPDGCETSRGMPIIEKSNRHLLADMAERNAANGELVADAPLLLALCERQAAEIERLRVGFEQLLTEVVAECRLNEANRDAEIARLRAALEEIRRQPQGSTAQPEDVRKDLSAVIRIARAALLATAEPCEAGEVSQ